MSSWSCPHDLYGICQRVSGAVCNPGMRGCVLHGKVVFANKDAHAPIKPVKAAATKDKPKHALTPKRRLPF